MKELGLQLYTIRDFMQTEEDIIVVNAESREETEKLYLEILEKIEEKNF